MKKEMDNLYKIVGENKEAKKSIDRLRASLLEYRKKLYNEKMNELKYYAEKSSLG